MINRARYNKPTGVTNSKRLNMIRITTCIRDYRVAVPPTRQSEPKPARPRVTPLNGTPAHESRPDERSSGHVKPLNAPQNETLHEPTRSTRPSTPPRSTPLTTIRSVTDHIDTDRVRQIVGQVLTGRARYLYIGVGAVVLLIVLWSIVSSVFASVFNRSVVDLSATPTGIAVVAVPTTSDADAIRALNVNAWNGGSRFTVLVMGLDKRPGEEGTGFRTDSIMLISIDPTNERIGILSIPRDLRVPMSGRPGMVGINTVYITGELERPGYGPKLLAETLRYNLGMTIDSYVSVSFNAVIELVDAIGGIDIEVPETIDDPEFPDMNTDGYDPLYIPAGTVHMDGKLALKYARVRHVGLDDYDRTRRQQQVILAIRNALLSPGKLANVLPRAPQIWESVRKNILTDLDFNTILSMGLYLKDIDTGSIQRATLDQQYLQSIPDESGYGYPQMTINRNNISELLKSVFGTNYTD